MLKSDIEKATARLLESLTDRELNAIVYLLEHGPRGEEFKALASENGIKAAACHILNNHPDDEDMSVTFEDYLKARPAILAQVGEPDIASLRERLEELEEKWLADPSSDAAQMLIELTRLQFQYENMIQMMTELDRAIRQRSKKTEDA